MSRVHIVQDIKLCPIRNLVLAVLKPKVHQILKDWWDILIEFEEKNIKFFLKCRLCYELSAKP